MRLLVITHVPHVHKDGRYYAYAPYVKEMNLWLKHCDTVTFIAPLQNERHTVIDTFYAHNRLQFVPVARFDVLHFKSVLLAFLKIPKICIQLFKAMQKADHIHLRCPGNIGMLGCIVQIFFPNTPKTAKYAGNWDPNAKQPWTYRLQKWILNATFWTKNMNILVYGEWKNASLNCKPFFTASYSENEIVPLEPRSPNAAFTFVFVGALVPGKNPLYAIKLIEKLLYQDCSVTLKIYGDGPLKVSLEEYINSNNLSQWITVMGNQSSEVVKKAYQSSHFVILPSNSEGWPKAIAEGMFWGCIPLATAVSCVSTMLDYGKRGVLLNMQLEQDSKEIFALLQDATKQEIQRKAATDWSRAYTIERFENEIQLLLQP
ncbi:hypothetical protein FVB9288_00528 [Flavobacterium sp. CECT 9288]|uniref:glycosyltransferase family 4 protein n=1 Tax=Flavobacterium sp. CECT 9288 TaxID=2845819 RepID=UPI001E5E7A30|nr:glycosyltransferase [Flavobacterium sp. CECT 9288]CAH0334913.1 hypothetical protein FVB9288_00528 [Flavobacterium sp. CECT 9288]